MTPEEALQILELPADAPPSDFRRAYRAATRTRRSETFTLERTKGKLSEAALKEARERMKRLKVHPRELLPNVTALARAEALYVELTGPSRDLLHELIAAFKLTLQRQVPADIDACRASILSFIGSIRT